MVKKAKTGNADAKKASGKAPGKKASKDPAAQNSKATIKSGLINIMLPAMVGSALVAALCGILLLTMVMAPAANQQAEVLGQAQAEQYLDDLIQAGNNYQALAQQLANSDLVKNAVAADDDQINQAQAQLTQLFPSATTIRIYRKGKAKKDATSTPPISFSQLDMVAKADKKNDAEPEIQLHEKKAYLTVVQAIEVEDRILGSVLMSFDLEQVRSQMPALKADMGYVELLQTFADKATVLYHSGGAQHKQGTGFTAKGSVPHWSARFYPATSSTSSMLAWILVAVSVVLVTLLSATSYLLLNRALQSNAMALAGFFQARMQSGSNDKPFTLGIFASLAQTLGRMLDDYSAKQNKQLEKAKQAVASVEQSAAAKTPELPDFQPSFAADSSHSMLDMELDGDDADLLSTAAEFDHSPLEIVSPEPTAAEPTMASLDIDVSPSIFRAYDIRGIVGETLTPDVVYALGAAIGSEAKSLGQDAILVARDGRLSSQELAESLAQGIQSSGCNVIDIGMVPTPVLYFATKTQGTQSGVMVTGSHNPPEYNGLKIVIKDETLAQDRIQALYRRLQEGKIMRGQGHYEAIDVTQEYMERICSDVVLAKPMRIVVDTGNGVAGPITSQLLEALGCMVTPLFQDVDGNFPNHHPDPGNPDNLRDLIRTVQVENAELGLAIDGDGDRLGLVTPSGKIIWPDRMLMLYARDLLARNPGADILYDVKCSRDVAELVSNLGGRAIMCATGHSLMKAKMKETGAVVGGELSGHIFFNDRWYGFDDALYSAARLLEILSMEPFDTEQVFAEFPEKFSTPELHIKATDTSKFKIMEKLSSQGNFDGGNLVKVDGVRVDFPDSWGLIRASNTTPVLVARFEGDSEAALERVKSVFREQLMAVDPSLNISF